MNFKNSRSKFSNWQSDCEKKEDTKELLRNDSVDGDKNESMTYLDYLVHSNKTFKLQQEGGRKLEI